MPTRRQLLQSAPLAALGREPAIAAAAGDRIRLAVSTYSYWHFKREKYPIEKVIEDAARLGFDGVEVLHRQMRDETPAYMNALKQAAFRAGLDLGMPSLHQPCVSPQAEEPAKHI